jgi:hypothetical protein
MKSRKPRSSAPQSLSKSTGNTPREREVQRGKQLWQVDEIAEASFASFTKQTFESTQYTAKLKQGLPRKLKPTTWNGTFFID